MQYIFPQKREIVYKIIKTTYVKKILNSFVIFFISLIAKSTIYSLLSIIICFNNLFVDFFIQIFISLILCNYENSIYDKVYYYEEDIYRLTKYFVNNYSDENYKMWKNMFLFPTLFISYFYLYYVEINSFLLRIYILQYLFCYIIIELKNKNIVKKVFPKNRSEFDMIEDIKLKKSSSFEIL